MFLTPNTLTSKDIYNNLTPQLILFLFKMSKRSSPENMTLERYEGLIAAVKSGVIEKEEDKASIIYALEHSANHGQKLIDKQISNQTLKNNLFGNSEKQAANDLLQLSSPNVGDDSSNSSDDSASNIDIDGVPDAEKDKSQQNKKRKGGNGRHSEDNYDAEDIHIKHESLNVGDACPTECGGKLYRPKNRGKFIRITGQSLAKATRYHQEQLRCALCGEIFKANLPNTIPKSKYDERFVAMLILHKYYLAVPFYRQAGLQEFLGVPLAASTQWKLLKQHSEVFLKLYDALESYAAQGHLFVYDDTNMVIQSQKTANKKATSKKDKSTVYLTGILAHRDNHIIPLYKCGTKAAGRHFAELWEHREVGTLSQPLLMCDGLSANRPNDINRLSYIYCNCLTHARRQFYNIKESYPVLADKVMKLIGEVYHYDDQTSEMTPQQRLEYHQKHSKPTMDKLRASLIQYVDQKIYEPNSKPMKAVVYILKRWHELTVFLRVAGAPLDSNTIEQALKLPIRIRKNSMFFKTFESAKLSCSIISVTMTAIRADENPVDYLTVLLKYQEYVLANPEDWLPWEFKETLALLEEDNARQALAS